MGIERSFRISLAIVGVMILAAALFHGIWYWFFPHYSEMEGLTPIQFGFINTCDWAIGCVLLFVAVLTLLIAKAKSLSLNHLRMFSALLFGFWVCRLIVEFLFPVRITFVFISEPSLFLKILMAIVLIILALPELLNRIEMSRGSRRERHGSA